LARARGSEDNGLHITISHIAILVVKALSPDRNTRSRRVGHVRPASPLAVV
jgi:hypothetical protein